MTEVTQHTGKIIGSQHKEGKDEEEEQELSALITESCINVSLVSRS